ncbi:MAG: transcriptional regulator [Deltaproteobacteria bacterium RIFOXYA12_FULL_58_15]|nr:MAG: transcriptional regulator [Deltaproteobacteria bacterium RIFOXYA12_FULL_58_15]OGR07358.1 MAG: transcriptional regulator [Deltaproteobacteria bacterium RIFOXYB12_FULL_58_9]
MKPTEFVRLRGQLGKTQKQMSQLLGTSLTAVHSYEQGWRHVPGHVERQILLLAFRKVHAGARPKPCWQQLTCPRERRELCPTWELRAGDICWLINGTVCHGEVQNSWKKKMQLCRKCTVLRRVFDAPPELCSP